MKKKIKVKFFLLSLFLFWFFGGVVHAQKVHKKMIPSSKSSSSKPTSRSLKKVLLLKHFIAPKKVGLLSIALIEKEQVWLDGHYLGVAPISYLRLGIGFHKVKIIHPRYGTNELKVKVFFDRHITLIRRRKRLGMRFLRGERAYAHLRRYSRSKGATEKLILSGEYCLDKSHCFTLIAGESLYIRSNGEILLEPPLKARLSVRSFRPKVGDGYLNLASFPMGILYVNGKVYAPTPLYRLPLPAGKYHITVRNKFMGISWSSFITIKMGKAQRIRVFLAPKNGATLQIYTKGFAKVFIDDLYKGLSPILILPLTTTNHRINIYYPNGTVMNRSILLKKGENRKIIF